MLPDWPRFSFLNLNIKKFLIYVKIPFQCSWSALNAEFCVLLSFLILFFPPSLTTVYMKKMYKNDFSLVF